MRDTDEIIKDLKEVYFSHNIRKEISKADVGGLIWNLHNSNKYKFSPNRHHEIINKIIEESK